ncbi:amylosucrase [Allomuricauda sp. SCSIO 65647]|uniref:amylosucrase n=1 Tax=Allomuricauda sp. SCSIO 65647 TaxID=2908843 RepID=UPI001F296262|nr:amylosucrase [Muricauda sp. SCSIO 65647]UJH66027.1 alpha amylase [Muricauda sp. SCSIO 65647]
MNQAALHRLISSSLKEKNPELLFEKRFATNLTLIKDLFFSVYDKKIHRKHFERLLALLPKLFNQRPETLRTQDVERIESGDWYQSEQMAGMQLYVDLFNKDLRGILEKIPYFNDLGINFLHLMPIMTRPSGENDGGYAVNSYHEIDKRYGTKKDLLKLSEKLRDEKMYLMLDFVVNHTSDEFPWAKKAKQGNKKYQKYYYIYDDRAIPDEFEKSLPEVFPEKAPGNFTYDPEMEKWVMTVFNEYQWDLNYSNPEVFLEMLENLCKMVNLGVDIVRFDALAFLWKKLGTVSQNLHEAHNLISLFKMCLQVVAPGTLFLAEAIVAPHEIIKYLGQGPTEGNECEVAYNASLMALLWNSIATKKTGLLYKSMANLPQKPEYCTWVNYIRCHDDIGLGLDDRFIAESGWNPQGHRKFLLDYYCQNLDWSPAKGVLFMYNPKTGDGRISGSAASLLGLEKALEQNDAQLIEASVNKIIMLHGIILSFGGMPIIYAGDEIAALNDYSFLKDKNKKDDNRWINRSKHNWKTVEHLHNKKLPQSKVYHTLKKLISIRKKTKELADGNNLELHHTGNEHVLVFERTGVDKQGVLVLCNFDEASQVINGSWVAKLGYLNNSAFHDLITAKKSEVNSGFIELKPYQMLWLKKL